MATTTTLTMGDVIDETLDFCHRYSERPAQIVVGSNALTSTSDTSFTLSSGTLSVSDVVEFDQELMLVTGVSDDATPVYTVSRGYLSTTPGTYATGKVGGANPLYPRYQVQRAINRSLRVLNRELPHITADTYTRVSGRQYVDLPATVMRVLEVGYWNVSPTILSTDSFRFTPLGAWEFLEDMPTDVPASGKALKLPSWVQNDQSLVVKHQVAYAWSDDTEAGTLDVPVGAEELPVLFAAARLVAGREVARSEIDKVEEWNHEAAIRGGVNLRLLQTMWADFYRAVDEARAVMNVPQHRPYRRMPRLTTRVPHWI